LSNSYFLSNNPHIDGLIWNLYFTALNRLKIMMVAELPLKFSTLTMCSSMGSIGFMWQENHRWESTWQETKTNPVGQP